MGTEAIDPQSIRNVTIVGDPDDTSRVVDRLFRRCAETAARTTTALRWSTDHIEHTIRLTELSSNTPLAALERAIRVADGMLAIMNAAQRCTPRLETALRVADDHQVARLCLVTGLDHPAADFERAVRTIADTHGAVPLTLQVPHGLGTEFDGAIDLVPRWTLEPIAAECHGSRGRAAEAWYRHLTDTVADQRPGDPDDIRDPRQLPPEQWHARVRCLTHIGDAAPVLCDEARCSRLGPLLDAVVRYLPSPLDVCQPEHALDY